MEHGALSSTIPAGKACSDPLNQGEWQPNQAMHRTSLARRL
jgi:hypothetical protein